MRLFITRWLLLYRVVCLQNIGQLLSPVTLGIKPCRLASNRMNHRIQISTKMPFGNVNTTFGHQGHVLLTNNWQTVHRVQTTCRSRSPRTKISGSFSTTIWTVLLSSLPSPNKHAPTSTVRPLRKHLRANIVKMIKYHENVETKRQDKRGWVSTTTA